MNLLLYITSVLCGICGMIIEFLAFRLVSPLFGSSMEVWAIIISVIMGGLALGYYFGGFLSQRVKSIRPTVYLLIASAGIWVGFTNYLIGPITSFTALSLDLIQFSLSVRTFVVVTCLFFVPVFLLGSIYPLIVSLLTGKKSASASGIIFALSTVGSILGSILTAFVFIPLIGTRTTFFLTAALLECIAFFGLTARLKIIPTAILIILLVLSPAFIHRTSSSDPNVVYQTESVYQNIKVIKHGERYVLSLGDNENGAFSSVYSLNTFISNTYYDYFSLLPLLHNFRKNLNVLIIGLGAGTMSRQLTHFYGGTGLAVDGVEIDGEVISVAKKYFALEQPGLVIHQMDGRTFLDQTDTQYDIIMVDVYARESWVPYHLATREFVRLANKHLRSNGILAYNVFDASASHDRLRTITATVRSEVDHTYMFNPGNSFNFMVLASPTELTADFNGSGRVMPPDLNETASFMKRAGFQTVDYANINDILTDDTAPEKI